VFDSISEECKSFIRFMENECIPSESKEYLACAKLNIKVFNSFMFKRVGTSNLDYTYRDMFSERECKLLDKTVTELLTPKKLTKIDLLDAISGI
jgi:hypothetical protein